ncbi:hypothetical protein [Cellulomonas rhizosphaerae]|uniref:hypothetical protein n=1 Tax=Cellulomonas rhizosphaerae TaxID=2293719 RepID=UPI0010FD6AA6|nr:hypothetical protein [Cellulomonas rhizosphaerae]
MSQVWGVPAELDGQHVVALPRGTDVLALAGAWFAGASWEAAPVASAPATRMAGARFRGVVVQEASAATLGRLRLGDAGVLVGPAPSPDHDVYGLAEGSDPAVGWMTAAARRTGGLVVAPDRSRSLVPDRHADVSLTLWSAQPMAAVDAVPLVRPALAGARVGPVDLPRPNGTADTGPQPFGVTAMFDYDGAVTLTMRRQTDGPVVLGSLDWREHGPWAYRVVWEPLEPGELETETPSPLHVIARDRVMPSMARVIAALWRAVGGTVVDAGGFVVTPDELRERATPHR